MRRVDCEGAEPIITQSAAGGRLPEHRALPVKPANGAPGILVQAVNNSAKPQTTSIRANTPRSRCEVATEPK